MAHKSKAILFLLLLMPSLLLGLKPSHAVSVLMYHRFGQPEYPSTNISAEAFLRHIKLIREHGYQIISLEDYANAVLDGASIDDRSVVITIDDAYRSIFDNAFPIIQAEKVPVTLFLSTAPIDDGLSDYMNWQQLRILRDSGLVSFGGHAHDHAKLTRLSSDEVAQQLQISRQRLNEELAVNPTIFAYPYGEASLSVMQAVKQDGYQIAFGQQSGGADPELAEQLGLFYLPRFPINEDLGSDARLITAMSAKALPIKDLLPLNTHLGDKGGQKGGENPPAIGFTLTDDDLSPDRLTCYLSGRDGILPMTIIDNRIEIRFEDPFAIGRTRLNCTMPYGMDEAGFLRWYWLGLLYHVNP